MAAMNRRRTGHGMSRYAGTKILVQNRDPRTGGGANP
jgi:hypothetical protein